LTRLSAGMMSMQQYISSRGFQRRQSLSNQSGYQGEPSTNGILVVAGGETNHLANVYINLRILREQLLCDLPVEVVYFGERENDVKMRRFIERAVKNVRFIDGSAVKYPSHHKQMDTTVTGYAAKVYALCYVTSFDQVLLLDADNLPLIDPSDLFQAPEFLQHGSMFWPDYWTSLDIDNTGRAGGAAIYRALRIRPPWVTMPNSRLTESGQVLLDRRRHADVLEWLWFLNSNADVVYKFLHGDKDTFYIAFHLAGKLGSFYQVAIAPREAVNDLSEPQEYPYRHQGVLQHAPDGRVAFHHRTAPDVKYFPGCLQNSLPTWCRVVYISTPLSPAQAAQLLNKTHEGRFALDEMDAEAPYRLQCPRAPPRPHRAAVQADEGDEREEAPGPRVPSGGMLRDVVRKYTEQRNQQQELQLAAVEQQAAAAAAKLSQIRQSAARVSGEGQGSQGLTVRTVVLSSIHKRAGGRMQGDPSESQPGHDVQEQGQEEEESRSRESGHEKLVQAAMAWTGRTIQGADAAAEEEVQLHASLRKRVAQATQADYYHAAVRSKKIELEKAKERLKVPIARTWMDGSGAALVEHPEHSCHLPLAFLYPQGAVTPGGKHPIAIFPVPMYTRIAPLLELSFTMFQELRKELEV